MWPYSVQKKGAQIFLSKTQAEPGRTVKQEQEQNSQLQTIILFPVDYGLVVTNELSPEKFSEQIEMDRRQW